MEHTLPPPQIEAHEQPWSDNEIRAIYRNAIEYASNRSKVRGLSLIPVPLLVYGTYVMLELCYLSIERGLLDFLYVSIPAAVASCIALIFCLRLELFTYHDQPTLFNRRTKKIHFFRVKLNWRKPFAPWSPTITTYDWNCVRAHVVNTLTGTINVPSSRSILYIDIMKAPDNPEIIDSYAIGSSLTMSIIDRAQAWEHIRRYMNGEGPALQPNARLIDESLSSPYHAFITTLLPPNNRLAQIGNLIFLPLALIPAVGSAFIVLTGSHPEWPHNILDMAGEKLSAAEINA